jgi:YHS domain-containing protein
MSHATTPTTPTVATDPVCGSRLYAPMAPAQSEREGRTFYFCSERCRMLFESRPERYLKAHSPNEAR